ncbi:MAG: hypothetical protein ACLQMH_09420 [Solirubrobacteraceae bacterium]
MHRVMVISELSNRGNGGVLLDERIQSVHLSDDHSAMQLIERLGWAIDDAEVAERVQGRTQARGRVRSPRAATR